MERGQHYPDELSGLLPFRAEEEAYWGLRVQENRSVVDMFGLKGPKGLAPPGEEYLWFGSFAYSLRGRDDTSLMSLEEASLYRRRFFETYPGLRRWHDREKRAWRLGETETRTLTGRRRMDVDRLTDRLNAPVQGTAADGLKLALAALWERRGECSGAIPVLVCHDEVVVECDADKAQKAKEWLEKAMIEGMDVVMNKTREIDVPAEVEVRITRSWGEGA